MISHEDINKEGIMKFEIKCRISGNTLFSVETQSLKMAVELAVKTGANLGGADLMGADLRDAVLRGAVLRNAVLRNADFRSANLRGADLMDANLSNADLGGADLMDANLRSANLRGANLRGADLMDANLMDANLMDANLMDVNLMDVNLRNADFRGAVLRGAVLRNADFRNADFRGAGGIDKYLTSPLYLLLDQVGKIRAYKLTNQKDEGPIRGGIIYTIGKVIKVKADVNENIQCSYGISVATLDWCILNWQLGYKIKLVEFTRKDIACIPIASDGKFRVSKCKVIKDKDLKKLGFEAEG